MECEKYVKKKTTVAMKKGAVQQSKESCSRIESQIQDCSGEKIRFS
jgi:hypothetical protein